MIQKTIHYCWLSHDSYPYLIQRCIESWHKYLPDYEFVLWDKEKANDIMQIAWVKEAYEHRKYAFAADYIRFYALYTEGGIYLDTDVEVVKSLNPLLHHKSFMGYETQGDFEAAIMGAEAGLEWIGKMVEYYKDRHFIIQDGKFDTLPLPSVMAKVFAQNPSISINSLKTNQIQSNMTDDILIYPREFFSPKSYYSKKIKQTSNTYTIHHFDGSWNNRNIRYYLTMATHYLLIKLFGQRTHNKLILIVRQAQKLLLQQN
jgi:mannosyltransferase OCH1-like enzyme